MNLAHAYQTSNELHQGHMMDHGWGDNWVSIVWMLLWLVLLGVGIIAVLGYIRSQPNSTDALNELKKRYAKGEIDKKEYESIKIDLLEK